MKTVHLDWSDTEGVSFLLRTAGLWPFEAEEISAVFVAAGYTDVGNAHQHFVSIEQPRPDGPQKIAKALEAIGYRAEHQSDLAGDMAMAGSEVPLPRQPVIPTPEQIVADVVANSRLSGYAVPEEMQAFMLRIARQLSTGEITREEADAAFDAEIKRITE